MSEDDRAAFDRAHTSSTSHAEAARRAVTEGHREEAEQSLIQAAREIDAALTAIGSTHRVRIEPEP